MRVDKVVSDVKKAFNEDGQLFLEYEPAADGVSQVLHNWSSLYPAIEAFFEFAWFSAHEWVIGLIDENKDRDALRLSTQRINDLQDVINEINDHLPLIFEAWSLTLHPNSSDAFHIGVRTELWEDLKDLTEQLHRVFQILSVDNSFKVVVSEGFILAVPQGPYSHFCATFALYLAYKRLELKTSETGDNLRIALSGIPGTHDDEAVEQGIEHWVKSQIEGDWECF